MPYSHLGAPYESGVTDHHKFWLDKRDVALQLEKQDSLNSSSFLAEKKGNWIVLELGALSTYTKFHGRKFCGRCTIKTLPTHKVRQGAGRAYYHACLPHCETTRTQHA